MQTIAVVTEGKSAAIACANAEMKPGLCTQYKNNLNLD